MANPLAAFRKHQKVLLAVFGVLLMLVFTVGTVLTELFQPSAPRGTVEDPTVVSWNGGALRESQIQMFRGVRAQMDRFQQTVAAAAAERGGQPQGMFIPNSEAHVVESYLLAQEAEKMGVVVGDESVLNYLTEQLADGLVNRNDLALLLQQSTGGNLTQSQLFDAVRTELMAHQLRLLANGTSFGGGIADTAVTPGKSFDYFKRLYRRMEAEVMPLAVADFMDEVTEQPTEAEINELYAEHKDTLPAEFAPTPGFKQPQKAAFQWIKADFQTFLDKEKADLSEDEILAYYEENKDSYRKAQLPDESEFQIPFADPNDAASDPEAPGTSDLDLGGDPAADDSDAAETAPAPETRLEAEEDPPETTIETTDPPVDEPTAEQPVDDGPVSDEQDTLEGSQGQDELTLEADSDGESAGPETVDEGTIEAEVSDDDVGENPNDTSVDAAEAQNDGQAGSPEQTAETNTANASVDEPTIEYQPLEEVRDGIVQQLARPLAKTSMDKAIGSVRARMQKYYGQYVAWQVAEEADRGDPPSPPDMDQLAQEFGMIAGDIPLVSAAQVEDYDLGRAFELSLAGGQINRVPFSQMGFSQNTSLFQPLQISASDIDSKFMFWKVDEKESFTPSLEDARDAITTYWKSKKALEIAKEKATEYARDVSQSGQSLRDKFGEDTSKDITDTGEFTWMTLGAVPSGQGTPQLSFVQGVEYPGDEFMKDVSKLSAGEAGVATNYPENTVYVVYMKGITASEEDLKTLFLDEGLKNPVLLMARQDDMRTAANWYKNLEESWGLEWQRPPITRSR